ncbi:MULTISPECIES: hypothetical protein [unclassified Streptomyces]|uniref:hypothetical protein n=1 Tax=unclassified Streptomyces TaxID=2593676 RepID=UPI000DC7D153|nr:MULTISPECIES: hypothetical protein [unclassified Streptomyces]AWZ03771.1 hypothetical protein DRB89_03000 [Streptomyces sp. ICC4]AWZ14489.1 hypothetical protein DRB96_21985 [Streptomyces sp. ICC1]
MRRGHVGRAVSHAGAWTLATGAAVTLSWWGVHTVMSGTAYDPPLAVPLTTRPLSSSTHQALPPDPDPSSSPSASAPASPSESAPSASAKASTPPSRPAPAARSNGQGGAGASGNVKSYSVSGGRVVFDLGASSGELVSATPAAGWRMQVWKHESWIRVTFTRDGREVSVFCTWHDHPPLVEIVDP